MEWDQQKQDAFLAEHGHNPVTQKGLSTAIEGMGKGLAEILEPLLKRIAVLEKSMMALQAVQSKSLADSFRGTWQPGIPYERGSLVTWDGSLWLTLDATETKPGSNESWRLITKRGRDGKDLRL